jgi:hypothetical protein
MVTRLSASFRLVLVAVLCGLNATCTVSAPRGREVTRCATVGVSGMTPVSPRSRSSRAEAVAGDAGLHQASLVRASSFAPDHLQHVSHLQSLRVASRTPTFAALSKAGWVFAPTLAANPLARENVLALGSAPRAPGLGRAPPPA